jgi:hypothetical protein
MNLRKTLSIMVFMLALASLLPVLYANERDQATRFTFNQPIQIPGRVLPAGSYRFQLVDSTDREIVRIFAEDGDLLATRFTIPCQRQANDPVVAITLADRGATQPKAIVAWFYAGETRGHEFFYPKQQARELAHAVQKTVAFGD